MALKDYELTYDFGDPIAEASACRTGCALFDFSFLECARVEGPGACCVVEAFTGRSLLSLRENEIRYALRTRGGAAVADLTVWRTGADTFEVMSGRREDIVDLLARASANARITDLTAGRCTFAVQGPRTLAALRQLGDVGAIERLAYFTCGKARLAGIQCMVGRLGYTGEAGFEIIAGREDATALWQALSAYARPAGFIAADMLRIEAGFVLFTNEFLLPVSPGEAGLGKFGAAGEAARPEIALVSFRADADHLCYPWRPTPDLKRPLAPGTIAVTSACNSIAAGGILGMGYVSLGKMVKDEFQDPVGTFHNIRLTPKPFYDTGKARPRLPWR